MVAGDVQAKAGEVDQSRRRIEAGLVGIGERQAALGQRIRVDRAQDRAAARAGHRCTGIEHFIVRRPANHVYTRPVETQARWRATVDRHDIDLGTGIVAPDKGDASTIRRNRSLDFLTGIAGQAERSASGQRNAPEIALGGEDEIVAVQCGTASVDRLGVGVVWTK